MTLALPDLRCFKMDEWVFPKLSRLSSAGTPVPSLLRQLRQLTTDVPVPTQAALVFPLSKRSQARGSTDHDFDTPLSPLPCQSGVIRDCAGTAL